MDKQTESPRQLQRSALRAMLKHCKKRKQVAQLLQRVPAAGLMLMLKTDLYSAIKSEDSEGGLVMAKSG